MLDALITMGITLHLLEYLLVVTAGKDGKHKVGSLHGRGYAVDIRSRGLTPERITHILAALRNALGPSFEIFFEDDHFHVEYDPQHDGGRSLP